MIKYPEGKDDSSYATDDTITGLGQWSIKNTKLRILYVGDNVLSHKDRCISDNTYLNTIEFGANISPNDLAQHISGNNVLMDINISDNHQSLCSEKGVVYDISKNTVWKYPEGRSSIEISSSATKIGAYAMAQCMQMKDDIVIPDNIEIIDTNGLYACQNITGISFNNTSRLTTLGARSLQLLSRAQYGVFPASLKYIYESALGSCWVMGNITFNSIEAPQLMDYSSDKGSSVFGSELNQWTGRDASTRVVFVPTNSIGYDDESWSNSIFSTNRISVGDDGETKEYFYTLSQTL